MSALAIVAEILVYLWPVVVLPALLMTWIRPAGRLVFGLLGLAFCFGIGWVMELGGPDSPGLIIPFYGLAVAVAALIAEGLARLARAVRKRRDRRDGELGA